jgi:MFS family permease
MGYGDNLYSMIGAAMLFGFGFGIFDSNNMPILCQFVSPSLRATGYGFLNTAGIFSCAIITSYLGKSTDQGNLGKDFSFLSIVVLAVIFFQLYFLKPKKDANIL